MSEPYPGHRADIEAWDRSRQLDAADLAGMGWREIDAAREAGRLDVLLGVDPAVVELRERATTGRITSAEAAELNRLRLHDLVTAAHSEGRIDDNTTEEN
jgi:hypothetical protein